MSAIAEPTATRFLDKRTEQKRSYALDALRGFAILTMVLSGLLPADLPTWMFHAQVPPPSFQFNPNLPGITWVDLVFPFFLFSMGAAIPLALSRRIERGTPVWRIVPSVLFRWVLLMGFALYVDSVSPWALSKNPTTRTYLLSILAFALLFPALARFPRSWKPWLQWLVRLAGYAAATAFVYFVSGGNNVAYFQERNDIIIRILADVSVFGAITWLVTRRSLMARVGSLGVLMAVMLALKSPGWVASIDHWMRVPFDRLGMPLFLGLEVARYLFIIVPGTIAGDMILAWMDTPEKKLADRPNWSTGRLVGIVALMLTLLIAMLVGLKARWLWETTLGGFALCWLGSRILSKPTNTTEKLLKDLYAWGVYWLVLGLIFEPYEGGIKKDSSTMSYYLVTSGLAIFLLVAFTVIIDIFKRRKWLQLLIDNGQNPMIAYIGRGTLIIPLLALTRINPWLDKVLPNGWLGFLHGVITTLLVALMVSAFTRLKVFWRT